MNTNVEERLLQDILKLDDSTECLGNIIIKPLKKGEGRTIGYLYRQYLSQFVRGNVISGLKIADIDHTFTAIPRVYEDVYKIISNLKKIVIKTSSTNDFIITINAEEAGELKAKDFILPDGVEIINPEQLVCQLTEKTVFKMECLVTSGTGFVSESEMMQWQKNDGMWLIGANYGPVLNVKMQVNEIAAGRMVSMEELVLEIKTNGSVTPSSAATQVAQRIYEISKGLLNQAVEQVQYTGQKSNLQFDPILLEPVSILGLGNRAQHCMNCLQIEKLGELVVKSASELLAVPNIGQNSVNEIINKLAAIGLGLEMVVSGWDIGNATSDQTAD